MILMVYSTGRGIVLFYFFEGRGGFSSSVYSMGRRIFFFTVDFFESMKSGR